MRRALALAAAAAAAILTCQCGTAGADRAASAPSASAWRTVYAVLQHARCKNCHPAGRVPLQGDDSRVHGQNVQGGPDGKGRFAMRCVNCHLEANAPGPNQPPGAPNWHLPAAATPLVFEGRSPAELARQLADPAHHGGRPMAQLLEHVSTDPLVLWGWNPGEGRAPVPVPHAAFVAAMRTWIEGGCRVPD